MSHHLLVLFGFPVTVTDYLALHSFLPGLSVDLGVWQNKFSPCIMSLLHFKVPWQLSFKQQALFSRWHLASGLQVWCGSSSLQTHLSGDCSLAHQNLQLGLQLLRLRNPVCFQESDSLWRNLPLLPLPTGNHWTELVGPLVANFSYSDYSLSPGHRGNFYSAWSLYIIPQLKIQSFVTLASLGC